MSSERKIIIAHRGASGYLPEHTLAAKALAYGMGADFIEQDVVLTRDSHPVVLHDISLDTVTNVATVFPKRARQDGRFYAIDFTLAELKALRVTERIALKTKSAVYPQRFPAGASAFQIPTLAEEIELIQGLNTSTGKNVGIYTEIKSPVWHRAQGKDISKAVLEILYRYGYRDKSDQAYLQCFDPVEARRIRFELHCKLKLVQLIAENDWHVAPANFEQLRTSAGIQHIAEYADGIGPWLPHVVHGRTPSGKLLVSSLVADAHRHGLEVHPYTFRAETVPEYATSFEDLVRIFFVEAGVDGVFTDFPDRAVGVRDTLSSTPE